MGARKRLQLVGVVATLIASKYEEIYPLEINKLVYVCDNAYTRNEIMDMEIVVLSVLDFKLRVPTAVTFLDRFGKLNSCSERHRQLVQYLVELALPEIKMICFAPSRLAAAAIFLSNKLLRQPVAWSQTCAPRQAIRKLTLSPARRSFASSWKVHPQISCRQSERSSHMPSITAWLRFHSEGLLRPN